LVKERIVILYGNFPKAVVKDGISAEIPKKGRFVTFQVMEHVLSQADMPPGDYFRFLDIVQEARRLNGLSIDGFEERPTIQ